MGAAYLYGGFPLGYCPLNPCYKISEEQLDLDLPVVNLWPQI